MSCMQRALCLVSCGFWIQGFGGRTVPVQDWVNAAILDIALEGVQSAFGKDGLTAELVVASPEIKETVDLGNDVVLYVLRVQSEWRMKVHGSKSVFLGFQVSGEEYTTIRADFDVQLVGDEANPSACVPSVSLAEVRKDSTTGGKSVFGEWMHQAFISEKNGLGMRLRESVLNALRKEGLTSELVSQIRAALSDGSDQA